MKERYGQAKAANKQSTAFALITLSRRLASSPYALRESLIRIKQRTQARRAGMRRRKSLSGGRRHRRLGDPGLEEIDGGVNRSGGGYRRFGR